MQLTKIPSAAPARKPCWVLLLWNMGRKLYALPGAIVPSLLIQRWARFEAQERNDLAREVSADDDELERVYPALEKALENDPPRLRSRLLRAWRHTHQRVESAAGHVAVPPIIDAQDDVRHA